MTYAKPSHEQVSHGFSLGIRATIKRGASAPGVCFRYVPLSTLILLAAIAALAPFAPAQPAATPPLDTTALVRRAVQHREQEETTHAPLRYQLRNKTEHRDTTKQIVETRDGDVARLIALDGKPLDATANQAELDRLDNLAQHPELQQKRHRSEIKDQQRVTHLIHMLPDALLYHLEGTIPCGTSQCYRLTFIPNPKFSPPDMEAHIFRGVAGELWIDIADESMTRIDANFIADVDFGLGILGKVNKGGHAILEQSDIGNHTWTLTGLKVNMTGKALLIKSLNFQITEEASHFSTVDPHLDYCGAIQLLEAR